VGEVLRGRFSPRVLGLGSELDDSVCGVGELSAVPGAWPGSEVGPILGRAGGR
jgi:hypothetical protein